MIDLETRTYSFNKYKNVWGAVDFSGVDEEGIVIASPDDMFTGRTGADGSRERSNLANFHKLITINLLKTNPLNGVLSGLHNIDALTNANKLPWLTKDLNGLTLVSIYQAWIVKQADITLKKEAEGVQWTLETGPAATFQGGTIL